MTEATITYLNGKEEKILVEEVAILDSGVLRYTRGDTVALLAPAAWLRVTLTPAS